MSEGIRGKLTGITVEVDGMAMKLEIDGEPIDPAVVVFSANAEKPNPILQALHSTPPSKRFILSIAVELS